MNKSFPLLSYRTSLPDEETARLMEGLKCTSFLDWTQLRNLAPYLSVYKIPEGITIFKEGAEESYLGIIADGTVQIVKEAPDGSSQILTTLAKGNLFGEMSLIDGAPRSASAICSHNLTLIVLTKAELLRLADEKHKLAFQLLMQLATLVSHRLRLTSGKLVDFLSSQ